MRKVLIVHRSCCIDEEVTKQTADFMKSENKDHDILTSDDVQVTKKR